MRLQSAHSQASGLGLPPGAEGAPRLLIFMYFQVSLVLPFYIRRKLTFFEIAFEFGPLMKS